MTKFEKILATAREYSNRANGILGLGFYDFATGESCYLQESTTFNTASMVKIYFLAELFRQAEQGIVDLSRRIAIAPGTAAKGSGVISRLHHPVEFSLYDHAELMMKFSDNTSTDVVLETITRESLRKNLFDALNLQETVVGESRTEPGDIRRMGYFTTRTVTSPRDAVKVLRSLHDATLMTKESCQTALEVMTPRPGDARIQKYLPKDVKVYRKPGSAGMATNDAGLICTAKGDYALALFFPANDLSDDPKRLHAEEMLALLSKDIYDIYMEDASC